MEKQLQSLKLDQLIESKTNPRSAFDKAGLDELAASIRGSGVIQPIVTRPHNGKFEIVVGARRFRAAKLAGIEAIPAIVRELTDAEVMEIQLLENLQREDISALDEGLGYRALIDAAGYDVAKVAEKIGKSQSYVYQRLKLADLTKPAQKALAEGKMMAGHAVQIARLQPQAQEAAVKLIKREAKSPDPMTVREVGEWIRTKVHRNLDNAPWKKDDASLLPKAGACTVCPKRAGTNPQLFPDLKPQTCTDPACYQNKSQAFIGISLRDHPGALKIIAGRFYDLDDEDRRRNAKKGAIPMSKYGEPGWKLSAAAGACEFTKEAVIILGETALLGQHRLVCAEPKCPVHGTRRSAGASIPKASGIINEERRKQIEELWLQRERQALKQALHAALHKKQEKLTTMPIEALRFAVRAAYHKAQIYSDAGEYFNKMWGARNGSSGFANLLARADEMTLLRLLLDLPLVHDIANKFGPGKEIAFAARAYKLPIPAITAAVHKEWAEKKRISYAKRDARLAVEKKRTAAQSKAKEPETKRPAILVKGALVEKRNSPKRPKAQPRKRQS